jgi:dynein light intermediate chain
VKYSTPVLVSGAAKTSHSKKSKKEDEPHHTEDILGEILPPKEHRTDNGQLWVQTVLSTPATKIEVIQLHEELEKRLLHRQAREIGLCPIREELFDQCFDEIIRQITIDCRQRGLLLVRVRDEYRNQTKAYKNLYESSINHAMRRVVDSDERKTKMVLLLEVRTTRSGGCRKSANS